MSEAKTTVLECAGCTAPLDPSIATSGVYRCNFCGYTNILPKKEQTSEIIHYLRSGDEELNDTDFERAYNAYSKAAELDSKESKAYFGMALASNRVKYIKDVVNNRWQAICCQITEKTFASDENLARAIKLATSEQKKEYSVRAKEIDYIREKFVELKKSGLNYDTFICVKVSDGNGGFTQDSVWAGKLYDSLKKAGLKPFYSEREIGDRVGEDYEALILYALYTSKSMIVVCSEEEYLRTPWVKNEYTRYYSMMTDNEKSSNSIMVAFTDNVIERIPGIPGKIQGVELHSFDASQKISDFVAKFANAKERARKEAEEKAKREAERKAKEEEELKAREEQRRMLEELQKKLAETEQRVQSQSQELKAQADNVSSIKKQQLSNTGSIQSPACYPEPEEPSYSPYSAEGIMAKIVAKQNKGKKIMRIVYLLVQLVLFAISGSITAYYDFWEPSSAFLTAVLIDLAIIHIPFFIALSFFGMNAAKIGKSSRRRKSSIVFSLIFGIISLLVGLILLAADGPELAYIFIFAFLMNITTVIFMKVANKKHLVEAKNNYII